ncbi:hypothetical protein GCM10023080_022890 [Streptomyces pseudoechinosporeus]
MTRVVGGGGSPSVPRSADVAQLAGLAQDRVAGPQQRALCLRVTPPLTTVRQPFDAAARDGLRLLVHTIEKPDTQMPPASDPPVELVVRASTAPPPSSPS